MSPRSMTRGRPWSVGASLIISATLVVVMVGAPSHASYRRPGVFEQLIAGMGGKAQPPLRKFNCPLGFGPPSMTPNGRFVAFASADGNLVENDLNRMTDVFVLDRLRHITTRVSVDSAGLDAIGPPTRAVDACDAVSSHPSISANGRYVAFSSEAINLVADDTNDARDVFRHDVRTGETIRVSVTSDGIQANGGGGETRSSISANGRVVAFTSAATNLVVEDTNEYSDTFLHDVESGTTRRVSLIDGEQTPGADGRPSITPDGRMVAFTVHAQGVYVYDSTTGKTDLVSAPLNDNPNGICESREPPVGSDASLGYDAEHSLSADGRYVVYYSGSPNHVPNDGNGCDISKVVADAFVYDRKSGRTERVSVTSAGEEATSEPMSIESWKDISITPNGRWVVFVNSANNLSPEPDKSRCIGKLDCGDDDAFLYDTLTGGTERISLTPDGQEGSCPPLASNLPVIGTFGLSLGPSCLATSATMSSNARLVLFWSDQNGFVSDDDNDAWDLFAYDRGPELGAGGLLGSRPATAEPTDEPICIASDLCIPPSASASTVDDRDDVSSTLTREGANLYGASIAYRPQLGDLHAAIELEDMPSLNIGAAAMFSAGLPVVLYGLRLEVADTRYEVRATSLKGGTFGLFDCSTKKAGLCTKLVDLRGGYGTSGERVVFSLPLAEIGLENGGEISDLMAFSALGGYETGPVSVLDEVWFGGQR